MTTFTVRIGYYEEPDATGLSWGLARAIVEEALMPFLKDDCDTCREDGTKALLKLCFMEPGKFDEEVDGKDYRILPEEAT